MRFSFSYLLVILSFSFWVEGKGYEDFGFICFFFYRSLVFGIFRGLGYFC